MSPFWYANQVKDPILLIHGEDGRNWDLPDPVERFYMALKATAPAVRYVTLPNEGARLRGGGESVLHTVAEMLTGRQVGEEPRAAVNDE